MDKKENKIKPEYCRPLLAICLIFCLTGCTTGFTAAKNDDFARPKPLPVQAEKADDPVRPIEVEKPDNEGSLWVENGSMGTMFINAKARRIGDIVTIKIVESAKAKNKASTETDRGSSLTAGLTNFFNADNRYPSTQPFFNPFSNVSGSFTSGFEGEGTTERSGDLTAYITARVTQVLPNGNLVLAGSREVMVNDENQVIRLTGIVRKRDINSDNQVLSTYISDAQIYYSGAGVIQDRQKPGWFSNFLVKFWPF